MNVIIFYLILFFNINTLNHPIHLTVTNIDYNSNTKKFNVKIRYFQNDFENAVNKKYNIKLNLNTENELKNSNFYINKYCKNNLKIVFDNNVDYSKKMSLVKKEINKEDKVVWLDYKFKANIPKKIRITNLFLTEMFPDQKNLLIFTCKNTQEALKFDNSNITKEISIN